MVWVALGIYVYITPFLLDIGCATEGGTRMPAATAPGDIIIGGIFPIHEDVDKGNDSFEPHPLPCVSFQERGLDQALAMINSIEVMNKSPQLADINITLGYRILDSCSDVSTALRATEDLIQPVDCHRGSNASTFGQPVMAVVGASYSEISIAIARQLTLMMIPQISFSSTAVILSDKKRFPAFMRTIPNDKHQTAAMVSLLSTNGWNWVGIVTTDGDYGKSALEHFVSQAPEKGICVAFKSILPVSTSVTNPDVSSAITQLARTIYKNPKVKVIVSFAKSNHMMYLYQELRNQMLKEGRNMESMRRIWVASDNWSSSSSVNGNLTLEDIGDVVGFTFKKGNMSSYREYLSRLEAAEAKHKGNNPFMQELYKKLNSSGISGDTELVSKAMQRLKEDVHNDTVFSIEMALSAIAQAVASICRSTDCKTPGRVQPWKVLKTLMEQEFKHQGKSYRFDSSGDLNLGYDITMWRSAAGKIYVHEVVASYQQYNLSYTNHNTTRQFQDLRHIISKCSNSCVPGEFKKTAEGQHTCCYECINCTENYFSNNTDMDQCLSCDTNKEWSLKGSSKCTPKKLLFFSWQDSFAVVLLMFSALGIVLTLLVSALFLHQRDTPVVKAAGGPLSQAILFSLVISYISAMLFVGEPNNLQCKARQVLFGMSFTLCVSCILVKTLQILLAFQVNPELQEVLRKLYQPYVIITVCMALQAATCSCWLVLKTPFKKTTGKPKTLLEYCDEGSYLAFGVMLGYIALLALVCFIFAFKGRKLPQQYNESKFITFSMLLYLISWLLFVPVYVNTLETLYLPAVEMVVILISNYGILSCHFFPKCYIIFFKKEQNTKNAFRKTLYEYSSKTTDSVSVSESSVSTKQSHGQHFIHSASSHSVATANPLTAAKVTTSCTGFYRGSTTHHCLRRSTSI